MAAVNPLGRTNALVCRCHIIQARVDMKSKQEIPNGANYSDKETRKSSNIMNIIKFQVI